MLDVTGGTGPRSGQAIALAGAPLAQATGAVILLHGRGGEAAEMLDLAELVAPPQTAWLAPQAAGHTWSPHRFIEPVEVNEPYLGSALSALGDVVDRVGRGRGPASADRPGRLLAGRLPCAGVRPASGAAARGRHRPQRRPDR